MSYSSMPPGAQPYPYGPTPMSPSDETLWSVLVHVSVFVAPILGPLLVLLILKERSAVVAHHAREALNFQITLMIVGFALGVLTVATLFLATPLTLLVGALLAVAGVVFPILGAIAAGNRTPYRYPTTIRLVR